MSQTGRLGLPYIITSQAQKEVTHNEGLNRLDAFITPIVKDIANAPPASPNVGELYIVGASPSEDFTAHANEIAQYLTGGWVFYTPFQWMDAVVISQQTRIVYDGAGWMPFGLIMKENGEYLRIESWQEDVDLSSSNSTFTNIPARSSVIAVNTRVISAIIGTVGSFGVGVSGDTSRYGNGIGVGKDSTNIGMSYHPVTYYGDTAILLTPDSGSFSTGVVRINVQYIKPHGPWNW